MNIHFTDKELFETLKKHSIVKVQIGSHLYGFNNEKSDIDYLYIHPRPVQMKDSYLWEHHQLQYKEDGIDHIFTDLPTFIRNILTGDSTINFEVLHELEGTALDSLYDARYKFYSYNVIRAYLGLARRDMKDAEPKNGDKRGWNFKKLHHAIRGYCTASMIYEGDYTNHWNGDHPFMANNLRMIKDGQMAADVENASKYYTNKIKQLRQDLNEKFEAGNIVRMMNVDSLAYMDTIVRIVSEEHDHEFQIPKDIYYEALENGIKY